MRLQRNVLHQILKQGFLLCDPLSGGPGIVSIQLPNTWNEERKDSHSTLCPSVMSLDNYDKQTCVNDGNQPLWLQQDDLFGIKKECCKKKVEANRYDQCMGIVTYLWTAQQSNVEISTNEEDCPPSTGWAASSDCRSYFMCQNGARSSPLYKCPANFIFDVESSECQQQSSVNCGSAGDTIAFKSEIFLASKPTGSPMESAPSPRPQHVSGGETSKAPLSSATDTSPLWFGVSVSGGRNKVQNEENKHMPQDFDK